MNKELILTMLQFGHDGILNTFNAVPDDKLSWKPLDSGRPIVDLFSEVAQTCGMVAEVARTRGESKPSYERFKEMAVERREWDKSRALAALEANFAALKSAVEGLSEEELATAVTMPIGGGRTLPLAGWVMMAYRSMISRFAQINYIQTLYGDFDMH
jgi:hypothetical protein